MLQNVGAAAALGILGRYDLEMRAREIAKIPATESANFNDNVNVSYAMLLSPEQRAEFEDTLNATAVMPNALNQMLGKLDSSLGEPGGRRGRRGAAGTDGQVHQPDGHDDDDLRSGDSRGQYRGLPRQAPGLVGGRG
jgi:hypothetical protein